jgi:glycosyltransferase involved in cell wall biosynthesis
LPSGGAKRHVREQARELARRGHVLAEFRPSTADAQFCPLAPCVAQERVFAAAAAPLLIRRIPFVTPYLHALQGLVALRRVDRLHRHIASVIDRDAFDVVFAQDCGIAMTPYVLRYLRTRSVFFCHHGFAHWPQPRRTAPRLAALKARYYAPARWLFDRARCGGERRNAQRAGLVLTTSRFARSEVHAHYGVDALVVGAGVDPTMFAPSPVGEGDYVFCAGELTPRKEYPFLVAALARVATRLRPRLVIAANMAQPEEAAAVQRLAAALGVTVEIVRAADDRQLAALYAAARVFVYAPRGEMLGMACLEAMSCGTPVVAVRDGGVPETMVDGVTGWLTERDPEAFALRVEVLLADDAARRRMGVAAAEHVRAAWTWQGTVDKVEAALAREVSHRH